MNLAVTVLTISVNIGIALTVFAYALRAGSEELRLVLVRERRLLARSLFSIFVITPAIALAVVELIAMPNPAKVAIVALSLSIVPPALPRKEHAAGGDRHYANALTLTVAIVAIVFVPLLAELLGQITGRPYGVPPSEIAGYVLLILGAPLVAGVLVRRVWPGAGDVLSEPLKKIAVIVATVAVVIHGVSTAPAMLGLISTGTVLGMLLFTVGSLAVGHFLGGPDREDRIVLALSSATRHPAIALTIATANFPGQNYSAALILCLIVNALVSGPYTAWQRRAAKHRVDETQSGEKPAAS